MTVEQWIKEGDSHFGAHRYQQALAAYEQAIRLDPANGANYFYKSTALKALKRYAEGVAACDQGIRLNLNIAAIQAGRGRTLHALKRYAEALAAYEQAIRLGHDPNDFLIHSQKGETLFLLNRFQEALTAFEQAIRLNPNDAILYWNKGCALEMLNRYKEALVAYEQSLRLDPTNETARSSRDEILKLLGSTKGAGTKFWVARRGPRDKDSRGNFHSMEKYAGPFSTEEEALAEAQRVSGSQRNYFSEIRRHDEGLAKEFGSVFLETSYMVISDSELEEARRRGIRIY